MRLPAVALIVLSLAACAEPPPERQSEAAQEARKADDLANAINDPIDKAKAVEEIQEDYDSEQAEDIEAVERGDLPEEEPLDDSSGG
jgi:hypothetical protein